MRVRVVVYITTVPEEILYAEEFADGSADVD